MTREARSGPVCTIPLIPPHTHTGALVLRWDGRELRGQPDELACEEPLEVRVRGRAVSVTLRTPGHDGALAAGFLLSEGTVRQREDVLRVEHCGRNEAGNVVNVLLAPDVHLDFARLTRHVFASSSCGLCGKASIDAVRGKFPPLDAASDGLRVGAATLASLPDVMRRAQAAFDRTGGLHAAALFGATGNLVVLRGDVGRHNAVDKVLGHCLMSGLVPLARFVLLLSGRSGFEVMQKALAGRVPVVPAVSAPSSLAATFAAQSGQALVGFLRGDRMNVCAPPRRVRFPRGAFPAQP